MSVELFQICYDNATRTSILPGCNIIDNSVEPLPGWFEFGAILHFLRTEVLNNDTWYGFLSPKFIEKTGVQPELVKQFLVDNGNNHEVSLFSPGWDQICYFRNPWEQGELYHPGLLIESQKYFDKINYHIDLKSCVTDTTSAVFCNYVIAKKTYWKIWRDIAEKFFEYVEQGNISTVSTNYIDYQLPMQIFVQERFPSAILSTNRLRVLTPDWSMQAPILLFPNSASNRHLLAACDLFKKQFNSAKDQKYLDMYWQIREQVVSTYSIPNTFR